MWLPCQKQLRARASKGAALPFSRAVTGAIRQDCSWCMALAIGGIVFGILRFWRDEGAHTMTLADAQKTLIRRCGKFLVAAQLDGTTINGTNADLMDPVSEGLIACGVTPADYTTPTTAEVQSLAASDLRKFLAIAEYRTLETVLGNWAKPDQTAGTDNEQKLGALRDSLQKTLGTKLKALQDEFDYGSQASVIEADLFNAGFQEQPQEYLELDAD